MRIKSWLFLTIAPLTVILSCQDGQVKNKDKSDEEISQMLLEYNKANAQNQKAQIQTFIEQQKWPMKDLNTGVYYWVYESKNDTTAVREGDYVYLSYTVSLLDGTVCYTAKAEDNVFFLVGRDHVESGIHEVVQLLHIHDKAKVVLTSNRAFGLLGDDRKIPMNSPVVYDIELLAVK
jgi:FKBP-type peptidyl-prolyl cis-trans isomerase